MVNGRRKWFFFFTKRKKTDSHVTCLTDQQCHRKNVCNHLKWETSMVDSRSVSSQFPIENGRRMPTCRRLAPFIGHWLLSQGGVVPKKSRQKKFCIRKQLLFQSNPRMGAGARPRSTNCEKQTLITWRTCSIFNCNQRSIEWQWKYLRREKSFHCGVGSHFVRRLLYVRRRHQIGRWR